MKEDETSNIKIEGYDIVNLSLDEFNPVLSGNIWISSDLIKIAKNANAIKGYIDNGDNVLVEGNINYNSLYKELNIPEKNQATKLPIYENGNSNLQSIGILIFKDNDLYYTLLINTEGKLYTKEYYNLLLSNFKIDKNKLVYQ